MRGILRVAALSTGVLLSFLTPCRSQAQVLSQAQLFSSVRPCRVADTRSAIAGILIGGVPRTFDIVGAVNYSGQGGVPGGCAIPGFVAGLPKVQAVAINIVAVDPSGDGFLTAWPTDQAFPLASTVNFQKLVPNLNIANGVIVPVRQDTPGGDITIVAGVSNAHVVIDIVGFFSKAEPRKYYVTAASNFDGSEALTACAAGYHMASLAEIFFTSDLAYNTSLGFPQGDNGAGPPSQKIGWIRTGFTTGIVAAAGQANCNAWTSGAGNPNRGSTASISASWASAATVVSPWAGGFTTCDTILSVWCVEN